MADFKTTSSGESSKWHSVALICTLVMAPILGCGNSERKAPSSEAAESVQAGLPSTNREPAQATTFFDAAMSFVTETTDSGLTIISATCSEGTDVVMNATNAVWIRSADATTDGWDWIVDNAGNATEWARDTTSEAWAVTQRTTGEFSIWVRVKTDDGIAWARTAIPAAWEVTRDAGGRAWVWTDEHKIEVAVAAAIVSVVVAALIVAPETVGIAVANASASSASPYAKEFLLATWEDRKTSFPNTDLTAVSKDLFLRVGQSVVKQCGAQIIADCRG